MKKFKALVTFAHGDNSFFPGGEMGEAPAELVEVWAKVGYVEPVEEPEEQPKAKKKGAVK